MFGFPIGMQVRAQQAGFAPARIIECQAMQVKISYTVFGLRDAREPGAN
jgi:hypothetical protein